MNVLLVDDSRIMRTVEKRILGGLGDIHFVEAEDGVQALQAIAATPAGFGLILVDWNMPNMDGLTLVSKIRQTDRITPVVMATSEADKARVMEAIKAGVSNYVIKPFTPEVLIEKVKQTLEKKKVA